MRRLTKKLQDKVRDMARQRYADPSNDDIEVDEGAKVTHSGDGGFWVVAHVYISDIDLEDAEEDAG